MSSTQYYTTNTGPSVTTVIWKRRRGGGGLFSHLVLRLGCSYDGMALGSWPNDHFNKALPVANVPSEDHFFF